ncbi:MAG: DEAD/DEAH box helicase [Verrucomicrobiota bacterium]|nr:DEAD/DEAH box helicase [Verrucomicrobiota bacterium]
MKNLPEFVHAFDKEAKLLLKAEAVQEPLFSHGTYQFEVRDKKEVFFPFLQIKERGLTDSFCTCKVSEKGKGCAHLAAAYLSIFNGQEDPLHVRFEHSLWNQLFQMAAKRNGYETDCLKKRGGLYSCGSKTKKLLFSIEGRTPGAKKKLQKLVDERVKETEETSLKFSNLSSEEIAQYRAGEANDHLRYELSFWSDLAKWLVYLQEKGEEARFSFEGEKGKLPQEMTAVFRDVKVWFYLPEAHWPQIVPTLQTVKSPLQVFDQEDESVERIDYDPVAQVIKICHREGALSKEEGPAGVAVGEWLFVEGKGFYRQKLDSLFQREEIKAAEIAGALSRSAKTLQRYLPVQGELRPANYRLTFDAQSNLHIELYVEQPGDLKGEGAALFPPWAYVPGKGFFQLSDLLFEEREKIVLKKEVSDFVGRHRLWLHQFPGFQTHLGSLEAHLTYLLDAEGNLSFEAHLDFPEELEETVDFDEWVYIKNAGFYMKKQSRGRLPLHPGLSLKKEEISPFIAVHKEDLEQVQHFFAASPIVVKTGLTVQLNEEGLISLTPKMEYAAGIAPAEVRSFGDFVYLHGRGFSEIPPAARLPERYRMPVVIPASQEAAFLAYEFETLKAHFLEIDPRLQKPHQLQLKIRKIQRDRRKRGQEWLLDMVYESELGLIDVFSIWDAFQTRKKHLFSPAGLLSLKEPRFHWLRQLPKRRIDRNRGYVRLNTLEWIRLSVFENISEPKGNDPESRETRKLLEELQRFETSRLLDIRKLKAQLRPYQELGLQWLWFLYCHGLSGLLCDDMGLGKTHQAMALLAAVSQENQDKGYKYLVVCPTSVIYHWQELLKKFLPDLRVCTYYGLARSLDQFEANYDLLLTSYGILRTGRDELKPLSFEISIFDEIQIAKNSASQTHLALKAISTRMRLGLTGTPIENRLRELKALFDIVLPGYMPGESLFRELFVNPIEKLKDEEKKGLLSRLVKPFILRRKKSEVLPDLPEKIEEISYCDLSEEQKGLYQQTAVSLRDTIYPELKDNNKPVPYVHVFSALSKLKQICDHPCLINGQVKKYQDHQSGKWDLFVELLYEARDSGQKVVVFSQYLDMLAIIEEYLKKKGIGFATIKGSTRDRSEQLRRFREDPACEVFTASLLAAGVGIDLTVASIVIHYDRWWNPAKENQATDRVHRIGQNRGVQVFKLVTKNTIEEHIHNLIERKKGLLEEIIGQDEADQINYLSRDELVQIFEKMFKEIT